MTHFGNKKKQGQTYSTLCKAGTFCYRSLPVVAGSAMIIMLFTAAAPPEDLFQLAAASSTNLRSTTVVKVQGRLRSHPHTQAGSANTAGELRPVELTRHEKPNTEWSIVAPGAAAVSADMDCTLVTQNADGSVNTAIKGSTCFPHVGFLGHFMWGRDLLELEQTVARTRGGSYKILHEAQPDGTEKLVVEIEPIRQAPTEQVPGELSYFDTRLHRKYTFNPDNYRMESAKATLKQDGEEIVIFETDSIAYIDGVS